MILGEIEIEKFIFPSWKDDYNSQTQWMNV